MLGNCLGIVVGDVSSHGMGPALLMSETRACLRTLAHGLSDVGEILTRQPDAFGRHARLPLRDAGPGTARPGAGEVIYGSAGQRSYLLHADRSVTLLDSTSLPLGVDEATQVQTRRRSSCCRATCCCC